MGVIKIISLIFLVHGTTATISGLSYMDPIPQRKHDSYLPSEDPCNPLYWYPRHIPEYCYFKIPSKPPVRPIPVPIPVPVPMPPPPLPPPPMPLPPPPMYPVMLAMPPPMMPQPLAPAPVPLPYGVPLAPSGPMIPVPTHQGINPFNPPMMMQPRFGQMTGMVPGIQGLVTRDGGINILPFSDVYSDLVDKYKNKMVRKKLRKLIKDYDRRFRY